MQLPFPISFIFQSEWWVRLCGSVRLLLLPPYTYARSHTNASRRVLCAWYQTISQRAGECNTLYVYISSPLPFRPPFVCRLAQFVARANGIVRSTRNALSTVIHWNGSAGSVPCCARGSVRCEWKSCDSDWNRTTAATVYSNMNASHATLACDMTCSNATQHSNERRV